MRDKYLALECRNSLHNKNWRLLWNARSSNAFANLLAKFSLKSLKFFWLYDVHLVVGLPSVYFDMLAKD